MKRTIAVLNSMLTDNVLENYAIGGAMAALFYAEPLMTYDLDVFIEGIPVQFLPAYNALIEEAVKDALPLRFEDESARVARPEHLLAIMAQTGRAKDKARIEHFLGQCRINRKLLTAILARHGLQGAWKKATHGIKTGER